MVPSTYNIVILLAMTIITSIVLAHFINAYAAVYTFGFWLINSSMLGLLFIPKVSVNLPHLPIALPQPSSELFNVAC